MVLPWQSNPKPGWIPFWEWGKRGHTTNDGLPQTYNTSLALSFTSPSSWPLFTHWQLYLSLDERNVSPNSTASTETRFGGVESGPLEALFHHWCHLSGQLTRFPSIDSSVPILLISLPALKMKTWLLVPDPEWLRMCYPKITMRTTSKLWLIQSPTTHPPKYSRVWFWCAVYFYHIYLITIMHGYTNSLEGHEANIFFAVRCNARPSGMCPVARHATSLVSSAWTTPTSSWRPNLNGPLENYQCVTGKWCLCFVFWTYKV